MTKTRHLSLSLATAVAFTAACSNGSEPADEDHGDPVATSGGATGDAASGGSANTQSSGGSGDPASGGSTSATGGAGSETGGSTSGGASSETGGSANGTGGNAAGGTGGDAAGGTGGETNGTGGAPPADGILTNQSADCTEYVGMFTANARDIQEETDFVSRVTIELQTDSCSLTSNGIPNHDFDDETASFVTPVAEIDHALSIPRNPNLAGTPTPLTQRRFDAIMLNGVVLDILSAGCYRPEDPMADSDGNVAIGCNWMDPWLIDPLSPFARFNPDQHNAHTQPDGMYHYHGNPMALFDDAPGPDGSPVIGFAADGFPIYGSYFKDPETGAVRKALSGYTLREGNRPTGDGDPGGTYNGIYNDDYEFTNGGDLDECNGMTVNGQYGYYVTDTFPWVIHCLSGTPDPSFVR